VKNTTIRLTLLVTLPVLACAQCTGSDEAAVRSADDQERIAALNRDTVMLERL
jgi:hypothetical protein